MADAHFTRPIYSELLTPQRRELFWSRVQHGGPLDCWPWMGRTHRGYGVFAVKHGDDRKTWRTAYAHRISWELTNTRIPDDLEIDHLCRNRACVNPDHLEVVTTAENVLRGIGKSAVNARRLRCANGHLFTPENTRFRVKRAAGIPYRLCRICESAWWREYRKIRKAKASI